MTIDAGPRIPIDNSSKSFLTGGRLDATVEDFAAAAMRAAVVDPLITEAVRLRCAQIHDCRVCGSLRDKQALEQGFDESMVAKVADYERSDLDPATIAALHLCDAIILSPSLADAGLAIELRRHFDDGQIAELCLDVVKWSNQKVLVALRLETPPWEGRQLLSFDHAGEPVFGGTVPA